jgi:hypothetical protein
MTHPKIEMEVPLQIREFAKKSVDQTEKAISSFIDSASKSVTLVPGPMTDIAKQTLCDHGEEPKGVIRARKETYSSQGY